jgi:hypothetical protein
VASANSVRFFGAFFLLQVAPAWLDFRRRSTTHIACSWHILAHHSTFSSEQYFADAGSTRAESKMPERRELVRIRFLSFIFMNFAFFGTAALILYGEREKLLFYGFENARHVLV